MNIREKNKLIAEFMGWKPYTKGDRCCLSYTKGKKEMYGDPKYHTSWNWLMPVVTKIQQELNCTIQVKYHSVFANDFKVIFDGHYFGCGKTMKKAYWGACIDYINSKQ